MLLTDGDKTAAATMAAAFMSRHPNFALTEAAWVETYFNMLGLIEAGREKRQMESYTSGQTSFRDRDRDKDRSPGGPAAG